MRPSARAGSTNAARFGRHSVRTRSYSARHIAPESGSFLPAASCYAWNNRNQGAKTTPGSPARSPCRDRRVPRISVHRGDKELGGVADQTHIARICFDFAKPQPFRLIQEITAPSTKPPEAYRRLRAIGMRRSPANKPLPGGLNRFGTRASREVDPKDNRQRRDVGRVFLNPGLVTWQIIDAESF